MREKKGPSFPTVRIGAVIACLVASNLLIIQPPATFGQDKKTEIDLAIVGMIDLDPAIPESGDDVQIGVVVENRGTKDARDVSVYFYEDGVSFDSEVVDVRADDSILIYVFWTAEYGDTYLRITVDPSGDFDEDKSNNSVGTWLMVR